MKRTLIITGLIFGILAIFFGHFVTNTYIQQIILNISTMFIGLSVGIIFINILLEKNQNKKIIQAAYKISTKSFEELNNHFKIILWENFGASGTEKILKDYQMGDGNIEAIAVIDRKKIFTALLSNQKEFEITLNDLEYSLDLIDSKSDIHLYNWALRSKDSMRKYRSLINEKGNQKNGIVQNVLDIYHCTISVRERLEVIAKY